MQRQHIKLFVVGTAFNLGAVLELVVHGSSPLFWILGGVAALLAWRNRVNMDRDNEKEFVRTYRDEQRKIKLNREV